MSFLSAVASVAGKMAPAQLANAGFRVAENVGATLMVGPQRSLIYAGNFAGPNLNPTIDTCINLYNAGFLSDTDMRNHMLWNGAQWKPRRLIPAGEHWPWTALQESLQPVLSVEQALLLWRLDKLKDTDLDNILSRHGFSSDQIRTFIKTIPNLPTFADLVALWNQGTIQGAEFRKYQHALGMLDDTLADRLAEISSPIPALNAVEIFSRGDMTQERFDRILKRNSVHNEQDKQDLLKAATHYPGPSDLVSFAVREVWNKDAVAAFGLDEEFDKIPEFQYWMQATGFGGSLKPRNDPNAEDVSIAKAYWRSHWQLMSPQQGYEALHRLRPNRMARYREVDKDVKPFGVDELKTLLKTADYPVAMRGWLAAISYAHVTRVDLRRLYDSGIINDREVYEQNLDAGYNPTDAAALTQWIVKDKQDRKFRKRREKEIARNKRLFSLGFLDAGTFEANMNRLGLSADETRYELQSIQADVQERYVTLSVKAIKRAYIYWEIKDHEATQRLHRLAIPESGVKRLVSEWSIERESRGRRVTAAAIAKWVIRGVVSIGDGLRRLLDMGYPREDALRMLRIARMDRKVLVARSIKQAAQTERERERAAAAEIRAMESGLEKARRNSIKGLTPKQIAKWIAKGYVDELSGMQRLTFLGIAKEDAELMVKEEREKQERSGGGGQRQPLDNPR